MQYRIINAILKEQIFPDGMRVNEYQGLIELQYKGQLLKVNKIRKSAMARYDFKGPLSYLKGEEAYEVDSVEQLIEILDSKFDIPISERLTQELISCRDGFVLTYEHFCNRQSLIDATLKFSRMPETINFSHGSNI